MSRIDFYAARDIEIDEELTYDYGPRYWIFRTQPSPETDSRNFSEPKYHARPPELSLTRPPPLGTLLPLTPLTGLELQAALALPEEESREALLRCLDSGGSTRTEDGDLDVPFGIGEDAEREVGSTARQSHADLQRAATACVAQAMSGPISHEFAEWVTKMDAVLQLVRRWRVRVPRFATSRHDAVGLAAYLLWKDPTRFEVHDPISKELCNELIEQIEQSDESGLGSICAYLGRHASDERVGGLVDKLEQWVDLGDGCTVSSHHPPALAGVMSADLSRMWGRVPSLVEYGLL